MSLGNVKIFKPLVFIDFITCITSLPGAMSCDKYINHKPTVKNVYKSVVCQGHLLYLCTNFSMQANSVAPDQTAPKERG